MSPGSESAFSPSSSTQLEVRSVMAKIVQVITRPEQEYNLQVAEAQVRDLDAIVEKLNSTFQEDLKDEVEAFNFFIN